MRRTDGNSTIKRKAFNLRINRVACIGTFFYNEVVDHRMTPPIIVRRESWLEFSGLYCDEPEQEELIKWLMNHQQIMIQENEKDYEGFVTSWELTKETNFSGRIEMIDKWYE